MSELEDRIAAFDGSLFEPVLSQTSDWDRRALLALHGALADKVGSFNYLEIGSYLGGSLQVLIRDPRCARIVSIDPRLQAPPDKRTGSWVYEDNSTQRMLGLLGGLQGADMAKLETIEASVESLDPPDLGSRPDCCFIDGEHTDEAALRDARFCARALDGKGVIAFHDAPLVRAGIRMFLREVWSDVSYALGFNGLIFACELGDRNILRSPVIDRAVASDWHRAVWRLTSRAPTPAPLLAAWRLIPSIDTAVYRVRTSRQRGERG